MLPHMNLLGFFHTEKPKKNFFEQPNNQNPKTPKPQNPMFEISNFLNNSFFKLIDTTLR